jgi:hypothetical protein
MPVTTRSSARRAQAPAAQPQRARSSRSQPATMAVGARRAVASQPAAGVRRSSRISARRNSSVQAAGAPQPTRRSARIAAQPPRNYDESQEDSNLDAEPTIVSFGERVEILGNQPAFAPQTSDTDSFSLRECASNLREATEMKTYWSQQAEELTQTALESGASEDELSAALALLSLSDQSPMPLRRSSRQAAQRSLSAM